MLGAGVALVALGAAAACGSRTGLVLDDLADGSDDAFTRKDAPSDRRSDVVLPPIDARPLPDVYRNDCPDAAITLIYVIANTNDLYSFDPTTGAFRRIGAIACPAPAGASPFSMAVDRKGIAYVVFQHVQPGPLGQPPLALPGNGDLFRVSTSTAACVATGYASNQRGISTFGMGFASNTNGADETLFIASDDATPTLGAIDVKTFGLKVVGAFNPPLVRAELTGTGDGRLFGFYQKPRGGSAVAQIDKATGDVIAESPLPTVDQGSHWAFGFWGGDFYMFTGPSGTTTVTRFRPSDGSVVEVGSLADEIVGAGVSTCAPEQ